MSKWFENMVYAQYVLQIRFNCSTTQELKENNLYAFNNPEAELSANTVVILVSPKLKMVLRLSSSYTKTVFGLYLVPHIKFWFGDSLCLFYYMKK